MSHRSSLLIGFFMAASVLFSGCGGGGGGGGDDSGGGTVPQNLPPTAVGIDVHANVNTGTVVLDGTGSTDPEGAELTYTWATPSGDLLSGPTHNFSFSKPGIYPFTLVVNDGVSDSSPDVVTVTVSDEILPGDFIDIQGFRAISYVEGSSDGGYYLLGTIGENPSSQDNDIYLQKIAVDGTASEVTLGLPASDDYPSGLVEVSNGVVAVVGTVEDEQNATSGDLYFALVDLNQGSVVFSDIRRRTGNDIIASIQKTEGGLFISGSSVSGSRQMRFLRYDYASASGLPPALVWDILVDAPGIADYGVDVLAGQAGEVIILGDISMTTDDDIYVAKLNVSNPQTPLAEKIISGDGMDLSLSLEKTPTGYLVIGSTNSFGYGGYDILALRLNSDLNFSGELSDYTIGGGQDDFSIYARKVTQTSDGFLVAGATQPENTDFNGVLLALDSNGEEIDLGVYNFGDGSDEIVLFARDSANIFQLAGISGSLNFSSPVNFSMDSPGLFALDIDPDSMLIQ